MATKQAPGPTNSTFKGKSPDAEGDGTTFNFGEPEGAQQRLRGDPNWKPIATSPTDKGE